MKRPYVIECSNGRFAVRFTGPDGKPHTLRCADQKPVAEAVKLHVGKLIELARIGQPPTGDLAHWISAIDDKTRSQLADWGLLNRAHISADDPIAGHIAAFVAQVRKESGDLRGDAVEDTLTRTVANWGRFAKVRDLTSERVGSLVELWKSGDTGRGIRAGAPNTVRARVGILRSFCRWAIAHDLLSKDPTLKLARIKGGVQSKKRALLPEEQRWLVFAAETGPDFTSNHRAAKQPYCMTGAERAVLYRVLLRTGRRSNEVEQLRVGDFQLRTTTPALHVPAAVCKTREVQSIRLPDDLADRLRNHFRGTAPEALAFPSLPPNTCRATMIRKDLARARVLWLEQAKHDPKEHRRRSESYFLCEADERGRRFGFHATRTSLSTSLIRAGISPAQAKEVTGHKLTATLEAHYLETDTSDQEHALAALESLDFPEPPTAAAATGTTGEARSASSPGQPRTHAGHTPPTLRLACAEVPENKGESGDSDVLTRIEAAASGRLQKRCSTS